MYSTPSESPPSRGAPTQVEEPLSGGRDPLPDCPRGVVHPNTPHCTSESVSSWTSRNSRDFRHGGWEADLQSGSAHDPKIVPPTDTPPPRGNRGRIPAPLESFCTGHPGGNSGTRDRSRTESRPTPGVDPPRGPSPSETHPRAPIGHRRRGDQEGPTSRRLHWRIDFRPVHQPSPRRCLSKAQTHKNVVERYFPLY